MKIIVIVITTLICGLFFTTPANARHKSDRKVTSYYEQVDTFGNYAKVDSETWSVTPKKREPNKKMEKIHRGNETIGASKQRS